MSEVYWEASKDSRYSATRRGIGHQGALWCLCSVGGHLGASGGIKGHRGIRVYWGLGGTVGTQGPEGYRGIRGHWGV